MRKVSVYSIYMDNIPADVISFQRMCVEKFLPSYYTFTQYFTSDTHAQTLTSIANSSTSDIIIFLDIDAFPLTKDALRFLEINAYKGMLTGAVQRANHKSNGEHLYIGPFCMAFDRNKYQLLGSPSFRETNRADIGEELTFRWEERGEPLCFLWPTHVYSPVWNLRGEEKFGLGTTYEGMFYHSFCIRDPRMHQRFVEKCKSILGEQACHVSSSNDSHVIKV